MGGSGSGRRRRYAGRTTEMVLQLDIDVLRHRRLLQPGARGIVSWSRGGHKVGSINVHAGADLMSISYHRTGVDHADVIQQDVRIARNRTHFGGARCWFLCPGCARRCRLLYILDVFKCRLCHQLKYEVQSESRAQRANRRARKIRRRLGGDTCLLEEFPARPAGMHRTTYERLQAIDRAADQQWMSAVFPLMRRHMRPRRGKS